MKKTPEQDYQDYKKYLDELGESINWVGNFLMYFLIALLVGAIIFIIHICNIR